MTVWLTFSYAVAWAPSAFVSSPATSRNVVDDFEEYLEEIDAQKVAQAIMKGFSQVYLVGTGHQMIVRSREIRSKLRRMAIFLKMKLFSSVSKNFLFTLRSCSRYLEVLYVSKKS